MRKLLFIQGVDNLSCAIFTIRLKRLERIAGSKSTPCFFSYNDIRLNMSCVNHCLFTFVDLTSNSTSSFSIKAFSHLQYTSTTFSILLQIYPHKTPCLFERVLQGNNNDVERRYKHYVENSPSEPKNILEKELLQLQVRTGNNALVTV